MSNIQEAQMVMEDRNRIRLDSNDEGREGAGDEIEWGMISCNQERW